jgi:hypothetical protein
MYMTTIAIILNNLLTRENFASVVRSTHLLSCSFTCLVFSGKTMCINIHTNDPEGGRGGGS